MTKTQRKLLSSMKMTSKQRVRLLREVRRVEADLYLLASALQDDLERASQLLEPQTVRATMLSDAAEAVGEYVDAVDGLVLPETKEVV